MHTCHTRRCAGESTPSPTAPCTAPHVTTTVTPYQATRMPRIPVSSFCTSPCMLHSQLFQRRWSSIPDGVVRDNCYNNTEEVDVQLRLFGFTTDTPLYVASYWDDVDPERAKKVGHGGVRWRRRREGRTVSCWVLVL